MPISEEDIAISMKARGKIAILEAKRQNIINMVENDLQKKRDAIHQAELQRDADLTAIDIKIQAEKERIAALIANV